jgi:hypothetical protein
MPDFELMGFKVVCDPSLDPDVVEIRDQSGETLYRIINIGTKPETERVLG